MPFCSELDILKRRLVGASRTGFQSTGLETIFRGLAQMNDDNELPEVEEADMTDVTDNSLITDFTQVVSCAVGLDRAERRRQKIRRELVQQYFVDEEQSADGMLSRVKKLFGVS